VATTLGTKGRTGSFFGREREQERCALTKERLQLHRKGGKDDLDRIRSLMLGRRNAGGGGEADAPSNERVLDLLSLSWCLSCRYGGK